ncbi:MAG TPA: SCO family protein [Kofleriaceae bacterium]|nr:SCO family protein [Kofleriaceae bacterium]
MSIAIFGSASAALADDPTDYVPPPPPTYKANGVTVDEQLGAHVPLDATFVTSEGKRVTLGSVLSGEIPTILTFNYSNCPMLCSLQLNGLSAVLPKIAEPAPIDGKDAAFRIGTQFRVVTIDLEPNEPIDTLAKMKKRYLDRLPAAQHDGAVTGWTFLAADGDAAAIRRVADAVGFKYVYVTERAEWAHPAALIFLSSGGAVTRYVYGIEFEPQVVRESIFKAGKAESATAVGFLNRCYHYDPDANSHAHAGVVALRLGAAAFIVLLVAGLGLAHVLRKHRRHGVSA